MLSGKLLGVLQDGGTAAEEVEAIKAAAREAAQAKLEAAMAAAAVARHPSPAEQRAEQARCGFALERSLAENGCQRSMPVSLWD